MTTSVFNKIQKNENSQRSAPMTPFSVLISVYQKDDPALFKRALQSVYDNSLSPSEVLLVQDGPVTAELKDVIAEFEDRYGLRTIALEKNQGLAAALNVGLKHIEHEFVFRADADDFNLPDRFEKQLPVLEEGYDLVGGAIQEVDNEGNEIAIRQPPTSGAKIRARCRYRCPFNHMTVCYRKSAVMACGGYPNIHLKEDYALWAKMIANQSKCLNLEDVLVKATTGHAMYERRGGAAYVRSELNMQHLLIRCGLQNWLGAISTGLARSLVFIAPAKIRGWVYETFLRQKPGKSAG